MGTRWLVKLASRLSGGLQRSLRTLGYILFADPYALVIAPILLGLTVHAIVWLAGGQPQLLFRGWPDKLACLGSITALAMFALMATARVVLLVREGWRPLRNGSA
ncbi:hypothetical protein RAS1_03000 [Phycisphaerae bacterium RAS1]|nr:hypothetical protein RAS1_03000 [Phycisphaerae bacterium RAS1]